jgi:hypothetical protein
MCCVFIMCNSGYSRKRLRLVYIEHFQVLILIQRLPLLKVDKTSIVNIITRNYELLFRIEFPKSFD